MSETLPNKTYYGVFSKLAEEEGAESLYRVEEDKTFALMFLGKQLLFTSFGYIETDSLLSIVTSLCEACEEGNLERQYRVGDKLYYARVITDEEMKDIRVQIEESK